MTSHSDAKPGFVSVKDSFRVVVPWTDANAGLTAYISERRPTFLDGRVLFMAVECLYAPGPGDANSRSKIPSTAMDLSDSDVLEVHSPVVRTRPPEADDLETYWNVHLVFDENEYGPGCGGTYYYTTPQKPYEHNGWLTFNPTAWGWGYEPDVPEENMHHDHFQEAQPITLPARRVTHVRAHGVVTGVAISR